MRLRPSSPNFDLADLAIALAAGAASVVLIGALAVTLLLPAGAAPSEEAPVLVESGGRVQLFEAAQAERADLRSLATSERPAVVYIVESETWAAMLRSHAMQPSRLSHTGPVVTGTFAFVVAEPNPVVTRRFNYAVAGTDESAAVEQWLALAASPPVAGSNTVRVVDLR